MYPRKTLTLAGELRRALRAEFPAVTRPSVTDPDFMEVLLDHASRSRSETARAIGLSLRGQLATTEAASRPPAEEAPPNPQRTRRRVYRGRVVEEPGETD
ncbi:MAG: hypothetical protein ACQETK_00810 [Pseudomonadota bacterium]